ncbi:MAG TPA: tRNA (adenine-N1)-methyltransferase [Acidimicrobiales bacterium]|nr:tRNA (adenine-N1)-methyltransferase [Acidimicrobiales bacterium]
MTRPEPTGYPRRGPLAEGERVLLVDHHDRRYLVRLAKGASFQTHAGVVEHDSLIGQPEGSAIVAWRRDSGSGPARRFLALRPTLADVIVKMPRGAQVIYPKDLGAILLAADLFPGARVLEAGVGSGALSMTALRAGCRVTGYELRGDFARRARANVAEILGADVPFAVEERDVYEGIDEVELDRVLLDVPEPWRVVEHAAQALLPGGILLAYLPSITQTAELRAELDRSAFALAETFEVLRRTWHIEGRSVRPDHRMVAHTGFVTAARRVVGHATTRETDEQRNG